MEQLEKLETFMELLNILFKCNLNASDLINHNKEMDPLIVCFREFNTGSIDLGYLMLLGIKNEFMAKQSKGGKKSRKIYKKKLKKSKKKFIKTKRRRPTKKRRPTKRKR